MLLSKPSGLLTSDQSGLLLASFELHVLELDLDRACVVPTVTFVTWQLAVALALALSSKGENALKSSDVGSYWGANGFLNPPARAGGFGG